MIKANRAVLNAMQSAAVALFACMLGAAAPENWIRLKSGNFELYSTAGERSAREVLERFQRVRAFFRQSTGALTPLPVRIVLFQTEKEYQPYRLNPAARAFYQPGILSDQIVIGGEAPELLPVAIHEYVHLLVRHTDQVLPPWLNEGIAELYSTMEPRGDQVLVGALIPGRVRQLREDRWVPLATILNAGFDSPYYNEKDKAGSLYNEGWALTHMLSLNPQYRAKFPEVVRRIAAREPSRQALENVYARSLEQLEMELRAYINGTVFTGVVLPAQLSRTHYQAQADVPGSFDIEVTLTLIQMRPGNQEKIKARLDRLVRQAPDTPDAHALLGMLLRQQKDLDAALPHLRKAVEGGVLNTRVLRDTAQAAAHKNDLELAHLAAHKLLEVEPDDLDARLMAAGIQLNRGKPAEALEILKPVSRVDPKSAPRFFQITTVALFNLRQYEEAAKALDRWSQVAISPEDKADAERVANALADILIQRPEQ